MTRHCATGHVNFHCFFLTEGQDFDFISGPPVVIEAGDSRGCLQISVITDEVVEPEEEIRLAINTMAIDFAMFGSIIETTVVILRDGGIYILEHNNNLPPTSTCKIRRIRLRNVVDLRVFVELGKCLESVHFLFIQIF